MSAPPSELQQANDAFRARLLAREAAATRDIGRAYKDVWDAIEDRILDIAERADPSDFAIFQSERYRTLQAETAIRMEIVEQRVHETVIAEQRFGATQGRESALRQIQAAFGDSGREMAELARIPMDQMGDLIGNLSDGSPLRDLLHELGPDARRAIERGLTQGIGLGLNPREVARMTRDAFGGNLSRALTVSRTEMLRVARSSSIRHFEANPQAVSGWIWQAALDNRTCFPAATVVDTLSGRRFIDRVQVGDLVLTHTGDFQRVYETLEREVVDGHFVTIRTGPSALEKVTATAEHPFLVEREGQLYWIEASDIRLTDKLVRKGERRPQEIEHAGGKRSIKRRVRDAYNTIAAALKPQRFALISFLNRLQPVPVNAINFENGIDVRQVEVDRVMPTSETMFLGVSDTHRFKCDADVSLRSGFSGVSPVTTDGTELLMSQRRDNTELFAACQARIDNWRSSAFFRAMPSVGSSSAEDCPASLARSIFSIGSLAFTRAVVVPTRIATWNIEHLIAAGARFFNTVPEHGIVASATAKPVRSFTWGFEDGTAMIARSINSWFSRATATAMRVFPLVRESAVARAEDSATLTDAGRRNPEDGLTFCTRSFHTVSISSVTHHIQTKTVYNLEVEEDHSYVANGFVVHNCMSCVMMHGREFPVTEQFESHPNCRCTPSPRAIGSRFDIEPGQEWFERQPEVKQEMMMGPQKYRAWKEGRFELPQLVAEKHDPKWGLTRSEASLRRLLS